MEKDILKEIYEIFLKGVYILYFAHKVHIAKISDNIHRIAIDFGILPYDEISK